VNGSGVLTPVTVTTNRFGPDGQPAADGAAGSPGPTARSLRRTGIAGRPGAGTFAFYRPDGDFSDTADYIRRYYDENPAA
jgi:hypothetical protein